MPRHYLWNQRLNDQKFLHLVDRVGQIYPRGLSSIGPHRVFLAREQMDFPGPIQKDQRVVHQFANRKESFLLLYRAIFFQLIIPVPLWLSIPQS